MGMRLTALTAMPAGPSRWGPLHVSHPNVLNNLKTPFHGRVVAVYQSR